MQFEEFMRKIGFTDEERKAVENISVSSGEIAALPQARFLDETYAGDRPGYVLALFARYLAAFSEAEYRKKGATRAEWLDTMGDLVLWSRYLNSAYGEFGVRETHWLAHLVRTEIFRLGRLQFVPRLLEERTVLGKAEFPAGTPYCEVHIPEGGKLLPHLTEASFARARRLFSPRFFSCESWLLSPKLGEFLQGGNILAFASRFTIVSADPADRSAERYLFGKIGDPHTYSATNSFSARVKAEAESGVFTGSGFGYFLA